VNLNNKQRIVLIIGAVAFLYVVLTSPKISIVKGTYVIPSPDKKEVAKIADVYTAITRGVAVLGVTLLISFALKDKKVTRTQSSIERESILSGDCGESDRRPIQRDIIGKILRFLKDFF
jgi:ABC-type arginine transport system permease subunit